MEFYYPYITNKKECRGCQDCIKSCPAHALSYNENFYVDVVRCKNYQKKIRDTCMNCMQYCRKNIIQLRGEK